jgi:hypothetical protein
LGRASGHLKDWIGDDNPVRAIDIFIDAFAPGGLRIGRVEPRAPAGRAQCRCHVADRPPGAGSQDERRISQGPWRRTTAEADVARRDALKLPWKSRRATVIFDLAIVDLGGPLGE